MNHHIIWDCSVRAPDSTVKWTTRKKIKWLEGTENITLLVGLLARSLACNVCASLLTATFLLLCSFQINLFFSVPLFFLFIFLILLFWNYFFSFLHLTSSYVFFYFFLGFNPHETTLIKRISPMLLFALAPIHSTLPMSVPLFLTRFSILSWNSRHPVPLQW